MEELKGIQLPPEKLQLKPLGDLLYHEGPILTHCINSNNEDFLMGWCEKGDTFHRWMLYQTTSVLLHGFFEGKHTLQDLILSNPAGYVFFVDVEKLQWKSVTLVAVSAIPHDYLPGELSTFDAEVFESYASRLKSYLEYQITRQEKLYNRTIEPETALMMEPPPEVTYQKTKK